MKIALFLILSLSACTFSGEIEPNIECTNTCADDKETCVETCETACADAGGDTDEACDTDCEVTCTDEYDTCTLECDSLD
ncbi:MAG: hypothetical protein Q8P18_29475 [Pseudomonadota bacterium]|nr:hypothetical protein [Pseudomonadota bacterium]